MGWSATDFLDEPSALVQMQQMVGDFKPVKLGQRGRDYEERPRLTLLRASTDGSDAHPNFLAALAATWVFGGGRWSALSAGSHDAHNGTPWRNELSWDLGTPVGAPQHYKGAWYRRFSNVWAAVNLSGHESGGLPVPAGLYSADSSAPSEVVLPGHAGVMYRLQPS